MTSDPVLGKCQVCRIGDLVRLRDVHGDDSAIKCDNCGALPGAHPARVDGLLELVSGNAARYLLVDRNTEIAIVERYGTVSSMTPAIRDIYRDLAEDAFHVRACDLLERVDHHHLSPCWMIEEAQDGDSVDCRMTIFVRWSARGFARRAGQQPPTWLSDLDQLEPADHSDTPECPCGEPTCLGTCGFREEAEHVG